jgi:hypothetical protein
VLEEDITSQLGTSWIFYIFGIQLEEAFGSLYLHLSIVSWRHYQPYTLFSYMYSRSAPFCMRSTIYLNKIRSEVFVAISCVICLASCCVYPLLYLYHLLVQTQRKHHQKPKRNSRRQKSAKCLTKYHNQKTHKTSMFQANCLGTLQWYQSEFPSPTCDIH